MTTAQQSGQSPLHRVAVGAVFVVVSGTLAVPGTSTVDPAKVWEGYVHRSLTECGTKSIARLADVKAESTSHAIMELRRISGLTWDQLGEIFGVSRRSVHHWASGKQLSDENERRLRKALEVVRYVDRGASRKTREALLGQIGDTSPFELLVNHHYEQARAILGEGRAVSRSHAQLSPEAKSARLPLAPDVLVQGVSDRAGIKSRQGRAARTHRSAKRDT